jgi:hypothetical protein
MTRQSERLEREAEAARTELAYSLDQLRSRMTPAQIVDEAMEYARATPAADFMRNLARDVRENPMPVLVVFAGVAWAVIASAIAQRRAVTAPAVTSRTTSIEPLPPGKAPVVADQEWEVAPLNEAVE